MSGQIRIAADVGWTHGSGENPRIFVAPLPHGPIAVLDEVGALVWLAVVDGAVDVVATVAATTGHPVETVRADVEAFLADLVGRGLLEPS